MRLICWFLGTDALTLVNNPPAKRIWHIKLFFYRIKWRILKKYFDHWAVHENLAVHLKKFGINPKIVVDPPMYPDPINKIPHECFTVLYYRPKPVNLGGQKYIDWYYGYDLYAAIKKYFSLWPINFIEADGSCDMRDLYAITDCYIRPNHWDGMPRMVLECQINNIPYMWCDKMNGNYLDPRVDDFINFIISTYERWKVQ